MEVAAKKKTPDCDTGRPECRPEMTLAGKVRLLAVGAEPNCTACNRVALLCRLTALERHREGRMMSDGKRVHDAMIEHPAVPSSTTLPKRPA